MSTPIDILFFGCLRGAYGITVVGHGLYRLVGGWPRSADIYDSPWGPKIDAGLLDGHVQKACHHLQGWTVVSFWDSSGDSRPGSNSAFLCKAELDDLELLRLAYSQWSTMFNRLGFPTHIKELAT